MVTQRARRSGSIAIVHTSSGDAAMSMLVSTSLICRRKLVHGCGRTRARSSAGDLLGVLPLPQRAVDGGLEAVAADAEQRRGAVVARQQVAAQASHPRLGQGRGTSRRLARQAD